nr:MAG TPA_asm: hypothetical protein [Caudoviricetes sp.]
MLRLSGEVHRISKRTSGVDTPHMVEIIPIQSTAQVILTHGVQLSVHLEEITVNHDSLNSGQVGIVRSNMGIGAITTNGNGNTASARGVVTSEQVLQALNLILAHGKAINFQTMTHKVGLIHVKGASQNVNVNRSRNVNRDNSIQPVRRCIHRNTSSIIILGDELHLAINALQGLHQLLTTSFVSHGINGNLLNLVILNQIVNQILFHNESIQLSGLINLVDNVLHESVKVRFIQKSSFQRLTVDSNLILNAAIHGMIGSKHLCRVTTKFSLHNLIVSSPVSRKIGSSLLHQDVNFLNSCTLRQNTLIEHLPGVLKGNIAHNGQADTVNQRITEIVQTRLIGIQKCPCALNGFSGILNFRSTTKSGFTSENSLENTNSSRCSHNLIPHLLESMGKEKFR